MIILIVMWLIKLKVSYKLVKMASNQVMMEDGTVNVTVTSKELTVPKPKDNKVNVALQKEHYHVEEKYMTRKSTSL